MADVRFGFEKPWRSLRYSVARQTIMPLASRFATSKLEFLPDAFAEIQRRWRRRLFKLSEAGLSSLESELRIQYVRNCPPFGIDVYPQYCRPCWQRLLCPFCWARAYPIKAFARMEALLYELEPELDDRGAPAQVLRTDKNAPALVAWFAVREAHELPQQPNRRLATIERIAADLRRDVERVRSRTWSTPYPHRTSDIILARAEFAGDLLITGYNQIVFSRKPVASEIEPEMVVSKPNKTKLVPMFTRAFAYPESMMTADPADVVCLVEALKRFHMVSFAGRFPTEKERLKNG